MHYSKNKIALVDCNSFYVSCERLFNPSIIRKPVIVLSSNDGCVISRSTEAKALDIKMGEPYFKVEKIVKKNDVKVFSSNYSLYGDISRRIMKTLRQFSPEIEIYSIDEAFLNLSSIKNENLLEYGNKIRKIILKWTGIPVSIGIASTKTLSKAANHIAKKEKSGVINFINLKQIDKFLAKIKINDVWGVASFYTNFQFQPPGLHKVEICWGPTCHILGAMGVIEEVLKSLGLSGEGTTDDGSTTLRLNTCLGACSNGPVMSVDHRLIGRVSPQNGVDIVNEVNGQGQSGR